MWVTAVAGPITELREDSGGLVLYTEDTDVLRAFQDWPGVQDISDYYQGGDFGSPRRLVATDLRFPRAEKLPILQALRDRAESLSERKQGGVKG